MEKHLSHTPEAPRRPIPAQAAPAHGTDSNSPSAAKYEEEMNNARRGYIAGTALTAPIVGPPMPDSIAGPQTSQTPGPAGEETDPVGNPPETIAWDIRSYDFLDGLTPDTCTTIHPNLLRQEQMNNVNGLFMARRNTAGDDTADATPAPADYPDGGLSGPEAREGSIYQIRSYDLATMSFVRSASGWIVIDPLGGVENVRAGLTQFRKLFPLDGEHPANRIVAVLVTHSHVDHYRGIQALTAEDGSLPLLAPGDVKIIPADAPTGTPETITCPDADGIVYLAPAGFYDEAISENLYLGNSMTRRSAYMYGRLLPHNACGHVGSGLGKTVGTASGGLFRPSMEIDFAGGDVRTFRIDGLTVSFLDAHDSEAPSECHIYVHDYRTLCPGENITHTMHNLLTSRGAKIRNPRAFARAIDRSLQLWGDETDTIIGTHHWPVWTAGSCRAIMTKQRDMYLFFNDQVIHRINRGMNMEEIAEDFRLPDTLASECYNRGYYGSVNHNVKAVFQYYVGWWDGNPANYYRYPEAEAARRFVDCMGGVENVLSKAREYFGEDDGGNNGGKDNANHGGRGGDYRWTLELTKQILFYPGILTDKEKKCYTEARHLAARAMRQLAYGFEAGTWRNIFLTGAQELRNGTPASSPMPARIRASAAQIGGLAPEQAFEYMSILVDTDAVEALRAGNTRAAGTDPEAPDLELYLRIGTACYRLCIANGVLHHTAAAPPANAPLDAADAPCCAHYDDMQQFSGAYCASMLYVHAPEAAPEAAPGPLDDLCRCLELPPDNWQIVYPLDVPANENNNNQPINEQPCV